MALMPSLNFNPEFIKLSVNSSASFSKYFFGVISRAKCGAPVKFL